MPHLPDWYAQDLPYSMGRSFFLKSVLLSRAWSRTEVKSPSKGTVLLALTPLASLHSLIFGLPAQLSRTNFYTVLWPLTHTSTSRAGQ